MPYHVEWYQEPHIVFVKLSGKLTREDFAGFAAELLELTRDVPEIRVHSLVDVSEVESAPPIPVVVQEIRHLLDAYPNRDMSTMYGVSTLVRYLSEIVLRLTPLRLKMFDTRAEAEAFIQEMLTRDSQTESPPKA